MKNNRVNILKLLSWSLCSIGVLLYYMVISVFISDVFYIYNWCTGHLLTDYHYCFGYFAGFVFIVLKDDVSKCSVNNLSNTFFLVLYLVILTRIILEFV